MKHVLHFFNVGIFSISISETPNQNDINPEALVSRCQKTLEKKKVESWVSWIKMKVSVESDLISSFII